MSLSTQVAKLSGRCLCGDIHFSITSKIGQILLCHCSQCRRSSGSPCIPYAAIERQAFMNSIHGGAGKGKQHEQWGTIELSEVAKRNFCRRCGSLICMDYHAPSTVWVPIGIFDDHNNNDDSNNILEWVDTERDSQIFTEDMVPWMDKLQSLPMLKSFGTYRADACGDISSQDHN